MKRTRQEKMLELISKYENDTQDELIARLRENGFDVTQATVSRDIRELNLIKGISARGVYCYALPQKKESNSHPFGNVMTDSVVSVDAAGNMVVIKTYPGLANAVASGVDALNMHSILGCVAGDDTIIIITRDEESSAELSQTLTDLMKTF